ncbi:MAG: DUF2292 domain-containing protein [Planctomycetaceae bacterium]|nr:DUF2292 domain-containing protein [Planctomycetaceae bacterium]
MNADRNPPPPEGGTLETAFDQVIQRELAVALRGLSFGQIVLVVHDGAIVQIDRIERRRLRPTIELAGT